MLHESRLHFGLNAVFIDVDEERGARRVELNHGLSGNPLMVKGKVIEVEERWTEADLEVDKYIVNSLLRRQSKLIEPFLKQKTLFKVARHLKRKTA